MGTSPAHEDRRLQALNRSTESPLNMLCWEGYDAEPITSRFKQEFALQLNVETLLSDAAIADDLLAGGHSDCDILNINNAYIRDCLEPAGRVHTLDTELSERYRSAIHPFYNSFLPWSYNASNDLIGIGQRYGPFNLVINTDAISRTIDASHGDGRRLLNRRRAVRDAVREGQVFRLASAEGLKLTVRIERPAPVSLDRQNALSRIAHQRKG